MPARAQDLASGARAASAAARRAGTVDRWLANRVQLRIQPSGVRLELWDGSSPGFKGGPTAGALVAKDR